MGASKMKRKILVSILLAMSLTTISCSGSRREGNFINDNMEITDDRQDNYDNKENKENEEDTSVNERELTQEQIDLLCNISVNEEKVRNGKLSSWQIEVLNQYDSAMEYLKGKYPSYEFVLTCCEPKNKLNSFTTFNFIEKNVEGVYYDMHIDVYEEESGNRYEIADNFYGKLFKDEMADKFMELMKEEFPECINVTTNISYVQGKDFGENLDLEKVLSGEIVMSHNTDFYINAENLAEAEYSEKVTQIKDFILEKGIYGSYDVKFVKESDQEDVLYMEHFFGE